MQVHLALFVPVFAPTSLAADTIFFIENTLNMLETMDHTVPYILSDHIW